MAVTNLTIREAVASALEDVPSLNVYAYAVDNVNAPAAVISSFDLDEVAFGSGSYSRTITIAVLVSRRHIDEMVLLDELLDPEGEQSIIAAINEGSTDEVSLNVISAGDYAELIVADVGYYGAEVRVQAWG